jgi:hypothetical protein
LLTNFNATRFTIRVYTVFSSWTILFNSLPCCSLYATPRVHPWVDRPEEVI